MRRLRVLLVTNDDRGGAAVLISRVARYLDPARFEVFLLVPVKGFIAEMVKERATLWLEENFQPSASRVGEGFSRLLQTVKTRAQALASWSRAARNVVRLVRENQIDVISAFGLEPHLFSAVVGLLTKTPVVLNPLQHYDDPINTRIDQATAWLCSVKALAAVSEAAADPYRFLGAKVNVCYNGVDPNEFSRATVRPVLRERFGVSPETPLIGFMGRPTREKGIDIFLRAAALVHQRRPAARFVLIGTGVSGRFLGAHEYPFRYELPQMLSELGILDSTIITGAVDEVQPYLADLDAIVIPSRRDAAPLVAYESMALEVPIVGANIHGIPELIRNEKEGLLAPVGDEEAFANQIIRLIDEPSLRATLARAAKERLLEKFDLQKNVAKMGELYLRAAGRE